MPKQRILYLDVVKFVAILLVCIGHAYNLTLGKSSSVREIIYSFHMPLFMILSGYFSINAYNQNFVSFVKKKAKQLLLPFSTVYVIMTVYHTIVDGFKINVGLLGSQAIALLWFLKTLFVCYLIVYSFKRIPGIPDWFRMVLSCLLLMLVPYGDIMDIRFMLLMFWTGYYWKKYCQDYNSYRSTITVISLLLFILLVFLKKVGIWAYCPFSMVSLMKDPVSLFAQYLIGASGSFMTIGGLFYLCQSYKAAAPLLMMGKVGQYTLGIFVMQYMVLEQVAKKIIVIPDMLIG